MRTITRGAPAKTMGATLRGRAAVAQGEDHAEGAGGAEDAGEGGDGDALAGEAGVIGIGQEHDGRDDDGHEEVGEADEEEGAQGAVGAGEGHLSLGDGGDIGAPEERGGKGEHEPIFHGGPRRKKMAGIHTGRGCAAGGS